MLDLGTVRPGSTIRIPYDTFDLATGASLTQTGFVVGDLQVYKDGGTTQRASTSGFTATTDFDSTTGIHLAVIDLSDDTTADFYNAGSEYLVAVNTVTVDGQTMQFWIARFRIGYPGAIHDTTIATLASQTSFTLTAGSTDASAYIGCIAVIHDIASATQIAIGVVSAYAVTTRTVTLAADPGVFTMAVGDNISFLLPALTSTTLGRTLGLESDGHAHADLKEWLGTAPLALVSQRVAAIVQAWSLAAITTDITGSLSGSVGSVTGAVGSVTGAVGSVTGNVGGNVVGSVASVTGNVDGNVTGSVGSVVGISVKKNTALANFPFFMVDDTDHVTPKTGLTITAQRSLDGAAFAACANAASELANGVYIIDLAASDLNADTVTLRFTGTDADQRTIIISTQT